VAGHEPSADLVELVPLPRPSIRSPGRDQARTAKCRRVRTRLRSGVLL